MAARAVAGFDAARIRLAGGYDRLEPPALDEEAGARLFAPVSPLARLLARNTAAPADARRVLEGRLRLFMRTVDWRDPGFSWHRDAFFSQRLFAARPYPLLQTEPPSGRDPSAAWELSRLQFVPTLVAADRAGHPACLEGYLRLVDSWIEANPRDIGVNWIDGMDVALRGINLALGLLYFGPRLESRREIYARVLWAHVLYVLENDIRRERRPRNNHFLTSLAGLYAMACAFRGEQAEEMRRLAAARLAGEILYQFRADGGTFEGSTHYHQVSLEGALTAWLFLAAQPGDRHAGASFSARSDAIDRVRRALDFVADALSVFGVSPQFGDSTCTRIFFYRDYFGWHPLDQAYLLEMGAEALPGGYAPPAGADRRLYADTGCGFFRNDRYGLCLDAMPCGTVADDGQGHHHCDKGSLVLQIDGAPLFVDNGTYCYGSDPMARLAFKSAAAHNVPVLDDQEPLDVRPEHLFGSLTPLAAAIRSFEEAGHPAFEMSHNGYARFPGLGRVSRTVRCLPDRIEIVEGFEGAGQHHLDIRWHLHPDASAAEAPDGFHLRTARGGAARLAPPAPLSARLESSAWSEAYGEKRPSRMLRFTGRLALPATLRYAIVLES